MPKGGEKVKTNELDKVGRALAKKVLFRSVIVLFAFIITVTPLLCLQGVASADDGVVPIFLLGWAPGESTTYPTYKERPLRYRLACPYQVITTKNTT